MPGGVSGGPTFANRVALRLPRKSKGGTLPPAVCSLSSNRVAATCAQAVMRVRAWAPEEGFLLLPVHREEHNSVLLNLVKLKARSEFMIAKETDTFVKLVRKELTGALEQAAGSSDQRGLQLSKPTTSLTKRCRRIRAQRGRRPPE